MVDSRKGERMADRIDDLAGRVEVIEQKVGQLSASVDQRFDQVDQRFDQVDQRFDQVDQRLNQVDAALVEQRLYTEFAYERLDSKTDAGFANMDGRFSRLQRVGRLDPVQLETAGPFTARQLHYTLCYILLRVLPSFAQGAPGPRPRQLTWPALRRSLKTRLTMSRLTPGQARSTSASENVPGKPAIACSINARLTPLGLFT